MKTNLITVFNTYNEKYGGGIVVSFTPSSSSTIVPLGFSWENIINLTGSWYDSSLASSTHNVLENYLETNFAEYIFNKQQDSHDFKKFDIFLF